MIHSIFLFSVTFRRQHKGLSNFIANRSKRFNDIITTTTDESSRAESLLRYTVVWLWGRKKKFRVSRKRGFLSLYKYTTKSRKLRNRISAYLSEFITKEILNVTYVLYRVLCAVQGRCGNDAKRGGFHFILLRAA